MDTTPFSSSHTDFSERAKHVLDAFKDDDGTYKSKALDEALTLQSELTEPLLDILKDAATDPIEFIDSGSDALAYAALLLAFWEETRALPFFIRFAQYDDDLLDDLWGDMVTQDFQSFLYRTGRKNPDALKSLARNPEAYIYIRVAALGVLNWSIIDKIVSRDEMLQFHAELFSDSQTRRDPGFMGQILAEWLDIYPADYKDVIEKAFSRDEIDETIAGKWSDVKKELAGETWERALLKLKEEMNRWMHQDIHDYTSWWSGRDDQNTDEGTSSPENPFKDLEADLLENPLAILMRDHGVSMRYHEMRAYLLGSILGIELVPPSHLISEILLLDTDEEAEFKNEKDAQKFFSLFMQLWNELAGWPKAGRPPLFDSVPNNLNDPEMTSSLSGVTLFRRRAEVQHLLIGFYESDTDSDTIQDPKARASFDWLEDYSDKLEKLSFKVAKNGMTFDESLRLEITTLLNEGDLEWPKTYLSLEEGLRKQRGANLEAKRILAEMQEGRSSTFEREEPKVGRNDPCPCGSGKKFKKCCLH